MADIKSIQEIWQFVQDNDGAITLLVVPTLSGLVWFGKKNWRRLRRRRLRAADVDTFPFDVILPNSHDVVQRIYGSTQQTKDDPLADFNIPYQQRIADRDIQQELMELVQSGWVAVLGPTGYGKTREVAELAKAHSERGWTVLRLTGPKVLRESTELPADRVGRQAKLLFLLDNFNHDLFTGGKLSAVDAEGAKVGTLDSPLQTRLLKALLSYTNTYGGESVRVVMAARNEQERQPNETKSQWEKLETERREYADFWRRFERYELLPPEDEAAAKMVVATAAKANVPIPQADLVQIARTNNRTFRNLVVNLELAKKKGKALTAENFEPTMQGTWNLRYRNALKPDKAAGKLIYDAVDLLRQTGVVLHPLTVMAGVKLLCNATGWQWCWQRRRVNQALDRLMQSERILEPRDGQIEAKGYLLEVDSYLSLLSQSMPGQLPLQLQISSWWGIALAAYERKAYGAALESVCKLIERPTGAEFDALVRWLQGSVLCKLTRYQEAITAYNAVIAIKPDYHEAFYNKGVALAALDRKEEAIMAYNAAIAIKPDLHEAFYNKGVALAALGRPEEAIAAYNLAIAIKPDLHEAFYNEGVSFAALSRTEEAITAYNTALAIKPDMQEAFYNKGISLAALGRPEEAIAAYDAALAIKPDYHEAFYNKGISLAALGRPEEAITAYDAALAIKPDMHKAFSNKGVALAALGRPEEAIAAYNAALAIKPDMHEAFYNKGYTLSALGRNDEAIAAYDAVLAIKPDLYEAFHNKGYTLSALGRNEEAITAYDAALVIEPNNPNTHYEKARSYVLSLQLNNALTFLQKAVALDATDEYIKLAKADSDFDAIRDRPQFQALITKYEEKRHSEARSL